MCRRSASEFSRLVGSSAISAPGVRTPRACPREGFCSVLTLSLLYFLLRFVALLHEGLNSSAEMVVPCPVARRSRVTCARKPEEEPTFFGHSAGLAYTTGNSNAFFGFLVGTANTSGLDNAFFGRSAGAANTTGDRNAFFGYGAGAGEANSTAPERTFTRQPTTSSAAGRLLGCAACIGELIRIKTMQKSLHQSHAFA
jgi:hypothetical protein